MENHGHSGTKEFEDDVGASLLSSRKKFSKFFQELNQKDRQDSADQKQKARIVKELSYFFKSMGDTQDLPLFFLNLPNFKHYQSCHVLYQEKGQASAHHFFTRDGKKTHGEEIKAQHFNKIFNLIKKSKNKVFNQNQLKELDLSLLGSFLANAFSLSTHNLIFIVSRNDFLAPETKEIQFFDEYCEELPPFLEKNLSLLEQENRRQLYFESMHFYPHPLMLLSPDGKILFSNFEAGDEKKIRKKITLASGNELIIYDLSNEDMSSEFFHHQRVSLLGELLNTLRHELNNPLFGMKLTADLLYTEAQDEEQKSILKEIGINVTRSQNIMENFTKLYTNTEVYEHCSLKKILDEALTLAKSEIRQVRISQFYAGELSPEFMIYTNPTSMVQIIFNLIINSSQAMRQAKTEAASIVFNFKIVEKNLLIEVSDNGPGIPDNCIPKLFLPFFTTKSSGTGLGLSITQNLVKHLKGQIEYVKREQGGAQFNLQFPWEMNT